MGFPPVPPAGSGGIDFGSNTGTDLLIVTTAGSIDLDPTGFDVNLEPSAGGGVNLLPTSGIVTIGGGGDVGLAPTGDVDLAPTGDVNVTPTGNVTIEPGTGGVNITPSGPAGFVTISPTLDVEINPSGNLVANVGGDTNIYGAGLIELGPNGDVLIDPGGEVHIAPQGASQTFLDGPNAVNIVNGGGVNIQPATGDVQVSPVAGGIRMTGADDADVLLEAGASGSIQLKCGTAGGIQIGQAANRPLGFFGVSAISQPTISETAVDPATTELQDLLIALGLAADGR